MKYAISGLTPSLISQASHAAPSVSVSKVNVAAQWPAVDTDLPDAVICPLERSARHQGPSSAALGMSEQHTMIGRLTAPAQEFTLRGPEGHRLPVSPNRWSTEIGNTKIYGDRGGVGVEHAFATSTGNQVIGGGLAPGHSIEVHGGHATSQGGNFFALGTNGSSFGGGVAHNQRLQPGTSGVVGLEGGYAAQGALHVFEDRGARVRIEQTRDRSWTVQALLAASQTLTGFGIHFGPIFNRHSDRRVWMSREEASRLLQKADHGWFLTRWYRRLEAAGVLAPPIPYLSRHSAVSDFGVGDRASWSTQKVDTGGVAAAFAGVLWGYYRTGAKQTEITLERVDQDTVHVTVLPKSSINSRGWAINVPLLGEAHNITITGKTDRDTYALSVQSNDLGPSCQTIADALLDDKRPTEGYALTERQIIHKQVARGGGLSAPSYIPYFDLAGFWQERRIAVETYEGLSPKNTVRTLLLTNTLETQRLQNGTRKEHVFAALRQDRRGSTGQWVYVDLTLGAEFLYDRFTAFWQPDLIDKIQTQFVGPWHKIEPYTFADNQPYKLRFHRTINADDLQTLSRRPNWSIRLVAQTVGANEKALHALCANLAYHSLTSAGPMLTEEGNANLVGHYLKTAGYRGLGAIHLLLGGDLNDWKIKAEHGAVKAAAEKASELNVKYATSPTAKMHAYSKREVKDCHKALQGAAGGLRGDPWLRDFAIEQRVTQEDELNVARANMNEVHERLHID